MEWTALLALGVATFFGALVQAATGFGFAILAAPVFLLVVGTTAAIPMLVALHVVQSAIIVPGLWAKASRWHLKRLVMGAVIGCPLGLWLFQDFAVRGLKLTVGLLILGVIALLFWRERISARPKHGIQRARHGKLATIATGALSGALTALLVMPGPPVMVYFMRERQAPDATRALSLSFFAVLYVAVTLAYVGLGQLPRASWVAVALLAPAVVAGTVAGASLSPRFSDAGMRAVLLVLLFLSGVGAIVSGLLE